MTTIDRYIRRCQECGCEQISKDPKDYKSDSWKDCKCRSCGSTALDYGRNQDLLIPLKKNWNN